MAETRFIFLPDIHYGHENHGGKRRSLHDSAAIDKVLTFASDFNPTLVVLGGDALDCGPVSHHNRQRPGATEGLKLLRDMEGFRAGVLEPLETHDAAFVYLTGNHERWIDDLVEKEPALEGIIDLDKGLQLSDHGWDLIPQGGHYKAGKLLFTHGDQCRSSQRPSKWMVEAYQKSIRFGHYHRFEASCKISAEDGESKTGICVPSLCRKDPGYGRGAPSGWQQGFNWGYISGDGTFSDYVTIITKKGFVADGRRY